MKKFLVFALVALVFGGSVFLITDLAQAGDKKQTETLDLVVGQRYTLKLNHPLLFEPKVVTFIGYDQKGNPVFRDSLGNELTVLLGAPGTPEIKEYKPAE